MIAIIPLHSLRPEDAPRVGGKAMALAALMAKSVPVPNGFVIPAEAYAEQLGASDLRTRIAIELGRKRFEDMRWEEIWDASLRIRNLFLKTPMPGTLRRALGTAVEQSFGNRPVVVRSSAPGEDSSKQSFAGLHESYVNVRGVENVLKSVRLVWASLWSDRALLYRKEFGLDVGSSVMAVVVQEIVEGERSGVVFTQSPGKPDLAAIEAVHGLNQGLVDGTVEPDRWLLERATGKAVEHVAPRRESAVRPAANGVEVFPLSAEEAARPPLEPPEPRRVFDLAMRAENAFGLCQDVEWTWRGDSLFALQSRPITAPSKQEDKRRWYLTLTRSFENLRKLREEIEGEVIPGMEEAAKSLEAVSLRGLSDDELAVEIQRRQAVFSKWRDVYWDKCIPFAHGFRLFGQFYNDEIRPEDPYEFVSLLSGGDMVSLKRNRRLMELASMLRNGVLASDAAFLKAVDQFLADYGQEAPVEGVPALTRESVVSLASKMAQKRLADLGQSAAQLREQLAHKYLESFEGEKRDFAAKLLDLARASYRWRDDDNIYLGKVGSQVDAAMAEARRRNIQRPVQGHMKEILESMDEAPQEAAPFADASDAGLGDWRVRARQIKGQPAGPGLAQGTARVVRGAADFARFEAGEVLVCDAIEPGMTFLVPLASGIVERRGGMLIHGAIIAREYGIPCITGVPAATQEIETGDSLSLDGFLGIVTVRRKQQSG